MTAMQSTNSKVGETRSDLKLSSSRSTINDKQDNKQPKGLVKTKHSVRPKSSRSKTSSSIDDVLDALAFGFMLTDPERFTVRKPSSRRSRRQSRPLDVVVGPMRVILIDSEGRYCTQFFLSVCHALCQTLIGAANVLVLGYTLNSRDYHAVICTAGWHFFSVEAIICLNRGNTWGTLIKASHKKLVHIILQICGMMCCVTGAVLILVEKGISSEAHGIIGLIAVILTAVNMILGPICLYNRKRCKIVHASFGITTFVFSSICFSFGVLKTSFTSWTGSILAYILVCFIFLYTLFIVIVSMCTCVKRVRRYRK